MNFVITRYSRIFKNRVYLDGQHLFELNELPFPKFAEDTYRHFQINYPKFHKMDNLCKLGFLGCDILLRNNQLTKLYDPYDIGIILSNRNSSIDTDIKHHNQIQTGPASPSVFVYSLPNIVIGEICIRHGIKGDNTFFINKHYDIPSQVDYISLLLNSGIIKCCIAGWVEYTQNSYDSFLYLIEKTSSQQGLPFTADQIKKLYTANI